jgi:hypothetical protein
VLFPQAGSATADPYTTVNLVDWRDHVASEIARWRYDPNYIPIFPLPIGNQTIGGDGKSLLLTQEIQTWSDQMVVGMGVPREFIFGGLSYAGTNVSMRMLENAFIGYITYQKALVHFIMRRVSSFMKWPMATVRPKPFKMADDLQRKAYLFQLNAAQKISDSTLLADADLNIDDENAAMLRETDNRIEAMKKQQVAMATVQGEASLVMAKYQAKAQQVMMEASAAPAAPGEAGGPEAALGQAGTAQAGQQLPPSMQVKGPNGEAIQAPEQRLGMGSQLNAGQAMTTPQERYGGQPGTPQVQNFAIQGMAQNQAQLIAGMPRQMQGMALQNLRTQSPEFGDMVAQVLAQMGVQVAQQPGAMLDTRPLPDQRAPRRRTGMV